MFNVRERFTILPIASATANLQQAVAETIERERVLSYLPSTPSVFVWVGGEISRGSTLEEAHANWTALGVARAETPVDLPRQPSSARCPAGIIRVVVECIERRTVGMGSYYGFEGYYASLLVIAEERKVWDVRGEKAS